MDKAILFDFNGVIVNDEPRHCDALIAAEDVTRCKPDPEGYHTARRSLEIPASACVIVEDSLPGLEAARGAGVRCAMLATSHPGPQLATADAVWSDFRGHHPHQLPWVA